MPYGFTFDLRGLPRSFFEELVKLAYDSRIYRKVGRTARSLVKRFRVEELTGLNLTDAISLFEDFLEIQAANIMNRGRFRAASGRKVLLLPHCARKYMDNRCKAVFDPSIPTYRCAGCSPDCLINQATKLAREKGYDVYVLPGGSCIPKILSSRSYSAVIGVACGAELKLGYQILQKFGIPGQAVPLLKNGCAGTWFDLEELRRIL
ncbi:MAG: hypothetical protein DRN64_03290 [Thaumarchaeota archaeon]|nr:MAG: hypothetical protein DRN64_03290 [Nitrososphaerota archaeon]HDD66285.1 DUF116 domain-containing protein [Nitrososphaeria archaeon]